VKFIYICSLRLAPSFDCLLLSVILLFLCQISPAYRLSYSHHIIFGLPLFRFLEGICSIIYFGSLFPSILYTCPYQSSYFFSVSFIIESSILIRCLISSFLIFSLREILINRRIMFISVASYFLLSYFFQFTFMFRSRM